MITGEEKAVIVDFDYAHITKSIDTMKGRNGHEMGFSEGYTEYRRVGKNGEIEIYRDKMADIFSAGLVIFFWLNGEDYCDRMDSDSKNVWPLDETLFRERFRQGKYKKLRAVIGKMCAERGKRYRDVNQVIEDMEAFLLEYCGNSMERYAQLIQPAFSQLLGRNLYRNQEQGIIVRYKVSPFGEKKGGNPLLNHLAWDIPVNGKVVMTIYNLDSEVYYISYEDKLQHKNKDKINKNDNENIICDGDLFVAENYEIEFWVN